MVCLVYFGDFSYDTGFSIRIKNLNKEKLINFETDKDQLFSIVRNYKLLSLLENDLSKKKTF